MRRRHPIDDHGFRRGAFRVEAIAVGLSGTWIGIDEDVKVGATDLHVAPLHREERMPQAGATGIGDDEPAVGEPPGDFPQRPLFGLFLASGGRRLWYSRIARRVALRGRRR